MKRLGKCILERRELIGLTQMQLGRKAGLHYTFIGYAERGGKNLSLMSLRKVAKALRVRPWELLFVAWEKRR